jgi:hypothetical protein
MSTDIISPNPRVGLFELAARCEAAEGPDRELDEAIARTLGWRTMDDGYGRHTLWLPPGWKSGDGGAKHSTPAFTASIDAALTLVPEGLSRSMLEDPRISRAVAHVRTKSILDPDKLEWSGYAKTLPLALCAAALRARTEKATAP